MKTALEPKPPFRRDEDFPKTTTLPEGWSGEAISRNQPISTQAHLVAGSETSKSQSDEPIEDESPFARRLEPFLTTAEMQGMWL